jgi:hypothetical protein
MATSVTASQLGVNQALASGVLLSADTAAAETLTVNHSVGARSGRTPTTVKVQLRSVVAAASSAPVLAAVSWNDSIATVVLAAGLGVRTCVVDVHVVHEHTAIR